MWKIILPYLFVLLPLNATVAENVGSGAPLVIDDQHGVCKSYEDSMNYFELRAEGKFPAEAVSIINLGRTEAVCEVLTGKLQYNVIDWKGPYSAKSRQMFFILKIHLQKTDGTWRQRFDTVVVPCGGLFHLCPVQTPGLNE